MDEVNNGTIQFENNRWQNNDQIKVYRHNLFLELVDKQGKILDLGCGDGLALSLLRQEGIEAQGLDISEVAIKKCRQKGLKAEVYDFSSNPLPFKDKEFNNVLLLDVLEHLYNPEFILNEALRVSRSGVIISVPNFNSLPARIQMLFGKIPENNRNNKGHIFWFNLKKLNDLIADNKGKLITLRVNIFWQEKLLIGSIIKKLAVLLPSLFALAFIVKVSSK